MDTEVSVGELSTQSLVGDTEVRGEAFWWWKNSNNTDSGCETEDGGEVSGVGELQDTDFGGYRGPWGCLGGKR